MLMLLPRCTHTIQRISLLVRHVPSETIRGVGSRSSATTATSSTSTTAKASLALVFRTFFSRSKASSGGSCVGVVVVVASGLENLHRQFWQSAQCELLSDNDWTDNQGQEDNKEHKVEDRITDNSALAQLCLLQRVYRRADLSAATC
jgi:hypothetical protein